jgi:hypothetical protein
MLPIIAHHLPLATTVYLYAAHRQFLKDLQDHTQTKLELVGATGIKYFEELIAKEQKSLAYAG